MIENLKKAIDAVLPEELGEDIKNNIDALIRSNFERMNLVTRDQLEIQEKIMQKMHKRVTELEKKVEELVNH